MNDPKQIIRDVYNVLEGIVLRMDREEAPTGPMALYEAEGTWSIAHEYPGSTPVLCVDYKLNGKLRAFRFQLPNGLRMGGRDGLDAMIYALKKQLAEHIVEELLRDPKAEKAFLAAVQTAMKSYPLER